MSKQTVASAHERINGLEKEVVAIKTEVKFSLKTCLVGCFVWSVLCSLRLHRLLVY